MKLLMTLNWHVRFDSHANVLLFSIECFVIFVRVRSSFSPLLFAIAFDEIGCKKAQRRKLSIKVLLFRLSLRLFVADQVRLLYSFVKFKATMYLFLLIDWL